MKGRGFLYLVLTLLLLGLLAVLDASIPQALKNFGDKFYFFKQQSMWALIGIIVFFVVSNIKYSFWEKLAIPIFFTNIVLLLIVLIPGFSYEALGARRWISFLGINFQPSEFIKLAMIIYFAKVASSSKKALSYFIPLVLIVGLIMLQPDLGTTMVICIIAASQILISGIDLKYLFGAGFIGILGTIGLIFISPYRLDRLNTFLAVTGDPLGKGYHIRQILLALGSGGLFGVGIGASRQKFLFLPEASTDSIFAVIAEETGFVGSVVLVGLLTYFFVKGFQIAKNAPDKFSQMMAVGITSWICGQAILNISAMTSLIPLTGIPLPFFSYGGSSLVIILASCGILLNINKYTIGYAKKR